MKKNQAKTILLVDDDAHMLETARDILEASDYLVRTAESGAAALESLRESASALMIVDLHLLDMTGIELALQAKVLCPEMVVVLMTGEASVDLGAAKSAVHAILTKPVNPPELFALIRTVI